MNERQIRRLEARLVKKLSDPAWKHKVRVVGEKPGSRLKWWAYGKMIRVLCWYWWHMGRLQAKLER